MRKQVNTEPVERISFPMAADSKREWHQEIHAILIASGYTLDANDIFKCKYRKGYFFDSVQYIQINKHKVEYYTETWGSDDHIGMGAKNIVSMNYSLSANQVLSILHVTGAINIIETHDTQTVCEPCGTLLTVSKATFKTA